MPRVPAKVTQADVARVIRAAQQAGAGPVEVRADGTILVHMKAEIVPPVAAVAENQRPSLVEDDEDVVL
jgi:hypothetical protein